MTNKGTVDQIAERYIDCASERDALRAENERLNQALDMVAEEREAWKAKTVVMGAALIELANLDYMREKERLRAALEARGPYCAQHGERQPCSQHKWASQTI